MTLKSEKLSIKTITCHDVYNFGASLQAYALMKHLQNKGHQVEIIDYKPDYLSFNLWAIGAKWDKNIFMKTAYFFYVVPKRLLMAKRRQKFDVFTKSKLNLTSKKYHNFDDLCKNVPLADVYFAGSDQIWNPLLPNGKDKSFFLDFVPETAVRASYAASFSVSEIEENLKNFVKSLLSKLDKISVRESSAIPLLEDLGFKNGEVVLDPVYLLPKSEWENLILQDKAKEPYIFIYDQENNKNIKNAALALSKKYNYKIYAIESLYPLSYAHKRINDAGPEDFLTLIKNCEICLTNSFHCISFSIIFNKNFYLFKRTHLKVNSRMLDLLAYLKLSNRVADDLIDLNNEDINYDESNILINKRLQSSYDYIDKTLELTIQKKAN